MCEDSPFNKEEKKAKVGFKIKETSRAKVYIFHEKEAGVYTIIFDKKKDYKNG